MARRETEPPVTPFGTTLDLQRLWFERTGQAAEHAAILPEQAGRMASVDVGTTPAEVVYRENKLELLHYEPTTDEQYEVPVLVVYALINRPYVLDLQPDRSVVRSLLDRGFDVYLVDWGEPSQLDAALTLSDYADRDGVKCVDVVRERAGVDDVTLLGYCMGGTMSAMYAALYPEKVRNLALLAAGLHFDDTAGVLELWGDYFDPSAITAAFGNVPSQFLDVGFALMDPVENFLTKYVRLFDGLDDDELVENFARMETWLADGIDVAGAAYVEFIRDLYQDNLLMRNELHLDGRRVDLGDVDMPVLQIVGEYDHLVPSEASKPFNDAVGSDDTGILEFPSGHIGLSVSSRSHDQLWPQVADWLAARSGAAPGEEPAEAEAAAVEEAEAEEAEVEEAEAEEAEVEEAEAEEAEVEETGAEAAEPEAAGVEAAEEAEVGEATEVEEAETEAAEVEEAGAEAETAAADLETVDGVGPTYADRLREAGVTTLSDLADADPAALAGEIDVSEKRTRDWVEQAAELSDGE